MARNHHFHVDQGKHSITVNVGPGRTGGIELLVNGKVIQYRREHGKGTTVLAGELPDEPVRSFLVRVHQSHLVRIKPGCTLELDGVELPMPERYTAF
ncbi:hypothetical protein ACFU5O_14365 [Streptomyces sp. NPDC057445]|uniref:hypothetical protein n=1 Tax=Streptomyces sp. NPDC057445 TaxID=3346136 RepID=UPI0036BC254B